MNKTHIHFTSGTVRVFENLTVEELNELFSYYFMRNQRRDRWWIGGNCIDLTKIEWIEFPGAYDPRSYVKLDDDSNFYLTNSKYSLR